MAFKEPFSLFEISTSIHASSCYFCVALKKKKKKTLHCSSYHPGQWTYPSGRFGGQSFSFWPFIFDPFLSIPKLPILWLGLGGIEGLSGYVTASNNNLWLDESVTYLGRRQQLCAPQSVWHSEDQTRTEGRSRLKEKQKWRRQLSSLTRTPGFCPFKTKTKKRSWWHCRLVTPKYVRER